MARTLAALRAARKSPTLIVAGNSFIVEPKFLPVGLDGRAAS